MKKFEFRMDRVMDAYQAQEHDALRKYSQANQLLSHEKNRLEEIQNTILSRAEETRHKSLSPVHANDALMESRYTDKLRQDEVSIIIDVESQKKKVNGLQIELAEAVRRRKVVELLREKKLEEYKIELKRYEQIEADEHTARNFVKNNTIGILPDGR